MRRDTTYQSPIRHEENTPLVTILETRLDTKESTATDSRGAAYVIDLTKASFGGIVYPLPGSQWFLKKISGAWAIMARAPQQNPQLNPAFTPAIGDTYIGQGGTVHIVNDLHVIDDVAVDGETTLNDNTVINGNVTINGTLSVSEGDDPDLGAIRLHPTNTAPDNWMICDGSAINRVAYADLFALVGTTYGVGDGSTTFNIPNLKGRVAVGRDGSQTEFDVLGETGGEKTHTLTSAEMPTHTHTQNSHTHATSNASYPNFAIYQDTMSQETVGEIAGTGWQMAQTTGSITSSTATGSTTATNQNAGSGGAHNNLQPYLVVNFIIKVLPVPGTPGGGGGGGASTLDELVDVTISSPTTNQVLKYNGSMWVNDTSPSGATILDELTDVVISAAGDRQVIQHNGTTWSNRSDIVLTESTAGTAAVSVKVGGDSQERLIVGADGKHNWGSGSATQDTNLYRSAADTLKTDDSLIVAGQFSIGSGPVEIDPSSPSSSNVLRYNGSKYISAALAQSDVTNLVLDLSNKQEKDTLTTKGDLFVATASAIITRLGVGADTYVLTADSGETTGMKWAPAGGGGISDLDDLTDVVITAPAAGEVLRHNGTAWVDDRVALDDLSDVVITAAASGEVLRHNGTSWVDDRVALDDLSDVVITSAASGEVLRHNGTSWVDDRVALDDLSDVAVSSPAAGHILRYDGSSWVNVGTGYIFKERVAFSASGTFTKANYAGLRAVRVFCIGGGGGGGGASTTSSTQASVGGGGGGGGYGESWILAASLGTDETVTIGAAGSAGTAGANNGGSGGTTSFGSLVVATGGAGGEGDAAGTTVAITAGGAGGAGTTADISINGAEGGVGIRIPGTNAATSMVGPGGASQMGPGGRPSNANAGGAGIAPAGGFGGGGSGGSRVPGQGTDVAGGAGRIGYCYVDVYI